jgi:hypothetical protein
MRVQRRDFESIASRPIPLASLSPAARREIGSDPVLSKVVGQDQVIQPNELGRLYDRLHALDAAAPTGPREAGSLSRTERMYAALQAANSDAPHAVEASPARRRDDGIGAGRRRATPELEPGVHAEPHARGAGGRAPAAAPATLRYDTAHYALRAESIPSSAADRTALRTRLDTELRAAFPGGYTINGVTTGSVEELRAMQALRQYGTATDPIGTIDHRGTESDLLVPTSASPMRMTVQTNASGAATATVHPTATAATPTSTFPDVAAARAALTRDFGVTARNAGEPHGGDASWTLPELQQLHATLAAMPADERDRLRGTDVARAHRGAAAAPAGSYDPHLPASGAPTQAATLTLTDAAFTRATGEAAGPTLPRAATAVLSSSADAIERRAIADASAALSRDFGMTVRQRGDTNGGDRSWTSAELRQVHAALSNLPASERSALNGLDLVRSNVGSGSDLAGLFSPNVETSGGARVRPASITLYNEAFAGDRQGFVGSGANPLPAHAITVLHEAGHAIEGRRVNDALLSFNVANDNLNAAIATRNATLPAASAASTAANTAVGDLNTALRARMTPAERREARAVLSANNAIFSAITALDRASTPAELTRARTALDAAITRRDTAMGAVSASHPARAELDAARTAIDARVVTARDTATAQEVLLSRQATRDTAAADVRSAASGGRFTPGGATGPDSARLAAFDAMRARSREAPVTAYGATGHAEAFAEAYMLYRADPEYLRANRPETFRWFDAGNHLQ